MIYIENAFYMKCIKKINIYKLEVVDSIYEYLIYYIA